MTLSRFALLAAGALLALAPAAARAHDGHGDHRRHGWHERGHQHHHRHDWHDRGHHDRDRWRDRDDRHHRHGWRDRDDHRHHGWHGGGYRPYPGPAYGYRMVPPPVWLPAPPPRAYAPLAGPGFHAPPPAVYGYLPSSGHDVLPPEEDGDAYAEAAPDAAEMDGPAAESYTVAIGGRPKR